MSHNVFKTIEITGVSNKSVEDAINTAVARAGKTIRAMSWFEVIETRGRLENDQVAEYQVTLKIGFGLE
ncbi:MAG TPA: dodecin family protein [Tepidisphaeraceae bacterium]|nr:dodecin family protein [Tepidisphaeraceae bacterium]